VSLYRRSDTEGLPSFVTTNTRERSRLFEFAETCGLLIRTIYEIRAEVRFQLLAFAIMPDHLHLIVVPPTSDGLGRVMQLVKGRFSRAYNTVADRTGAIWQNRYHERTLRSEAALFRAIEYVHNNPVAACLASAPEKYRWSTANEKFVTDLDVYLGQAEA